MEDLNARWETLQRRKLSRGTTSMRLEPEGYHQTMRQEIKDYMKMSERLISLAVQSEELSEEECQILDYYATELQNKVHSICLRKTGTISLPPSSTANT